MDKRLEFGPRPEKGPGGCGVCVAATFLGHGVILPQGKPRVIGRPRLVQPKPKSGVP